MDRKHQDAHGRFLPGNPGGPGNPHSGQIVKFRAALMDALAGTDGDADDARTNFQKITDELVKQAVHGRAWAIKECLNRAIGKEALKLEMGDDAAVGVRLLIAALVSNPAIAAEIERLGIELPTDAEPDS